MTSQRVALVTAGASGIGKSIAEKLSDDGFKVHICDCDEKVLSACTADIAEVTGSVCDVSNASEVDHVFDDLDTRYGRLDVLVNNAGIAGPTSPVEHIKIEEWDRTISVDLSSAFYVTRRATPLLKRRGGSIVNIASNAAMFGFPLRSAYTASKWALLGLTKTWAMELGPHGVNVNALCPGSVNGQRIEGVIKRDAEERDLDFAQVRDVYLRQSSMRVFVEPEDIASTVSFLCSSAGRNISGQAIGIDGHTESLSNWLS